MLSLKKKTTISKLPLNLFSAFITLFHFTTFFILIPIQFSLSLPSIIINDDDAHFSSKVVDQQYQPAEISSSSSSSSYSRNTTSNSTTSSHHHHPSPSSPDIVIVSLPVTRFPGKQLSLFRQSRRGFVSYPSPFSQRSRRRRRWCNKSNAAEPPRGSRS